MTTSATALAPSMPRYATYPSLIDRTVLITGGATGIGATLVSEFAAQGSRVGFLDIDAVSGEALAASLTGSSRHAPVFVRADVTDIDALQAAIAEVRGRCGPIEALMNNAANDQRHAMEATTSASWDQGIAVNLKHQFFAAQAVAPDMRAAGGGAIVNFGSISWMLKQGGMPVYTASKAAVQGLTRSLARDLGRYNIRVTTLVPGWVMTDKQVRLWVDDAAKAEIARLQCIDQRLMPADIARMAMFLAADDGALCTAHDFQVDAGIV